MTVSNLFVSFPQKKLISRSQTTGEEIGYDLASQTEELRVKNAEKSRRELRKVAGIAAETKIEAASVWSELILSFHPRKAILSSLFRRLISITSFFA